MSEALRDLYRDISEISHRTEGIRYSATLSDGSAVTVVALAPALVAGIQDTERFFETLERAALVRHEQLASPVEWGRATDGTIHVAFSAPGDEPASVASTPAAVCAVGVQLLHALEAVHATGLAHGAITRDRVLRGRDSVLLADFGLFPALVTGGVGVRDVVSALCEPPYVGPELRTGSVPDERSDVYAIGAVLYELLTGKPPYGGRTTSYVLASVLADEEENGPGDGALPAVDAIMRAIEREPDDRWQSAAAFAQALAAAIGSSREKPRVAGRRMGCLPAAAAVLVLAAVLRALQR
jgi:hypothetical protein